MQKNWTNKTKADQRQIQKKPKQKACDQIMSNEINSKQHIVQNVYSKQFMHYYQPKQSTI